MKIRVLIEGDSFAFSGCESDLRELINAAIQMVYGRDTASSFSFTLVDVLDLPASSLLPLHTYTVLKSPKAPVKSVGQRLKQEGLTFNIRPKACFRDEAEVIKTGSRSRVQPDPRALLALSTSMSLSEDLVMSLFGGSDTLRVDGNLTSRREICIDLAGKFTWSFGGRCMGSDTLEGVRTEDDWVVCGDRRFHLIRKEDASYWTLVPYLDVLGFAYFLRTYERCAILNRWGDGM